MPLARRPGEPRLRGVWPELLEHPNWAAGPGSTRCRQPSAGHVLTVSQDPARARYATETPVLLASSRVRSLSLRSASGWDQITAVLSQKVETGQVHRARNGDGRQVLWDIPR
jgi:hypothetical protein